MYVYMFVMVFRFALVHLVSVPRCGGMLEHNTHGKHARAAILLAVQQGKAGSAYTYVCMYRREIEASQSVGRQMMPSDRAATPIALAVAAFDEWTLDLCQTDNDS